MKFRLEIKIEHYVYEEFEAEDEIAAQDIAEEYKSDAIEHASEDVRMELECLDDGESED